MRQLARLSRDFLKLHRIDRHHLKTVADLSDEDVIQICHRCCEERHITAEWEAFRAAREDLSVYPDPSAPNSESC